MRVMWAVVLAFVVLAWARPARADCASIEECQDEVIRQTAERDIAARRVKAWARETAVAATLTAQPSPTLTPQPSPTLTVQPSPTITPSPSPTLTAQPSRNLMPPPAPTLTALNEQPSPNEGVSPLLLRVLAVVVCGLGLVGVIAWMVKRG